MRVIASTNKVLEDVLDKKQLREDLYYRLNVFHIRLPALRERREDIPAIAETLIRHLNKKHDSHVADLEPEVLERFHAYRWPGNIRELENTIARAIALANTQVLGPDDFGLLERDRKALAPLADGVSLPTICEA